MKNPYIAGFLKKYQSLTFDCKSVTKINMRITPTGKEESEEKCQPPTRNSPR